MDLLIVGLLLNLSENFDADCHIEEDRLKLVSVVSHDSLLLDQHLVESLIDLMDFLFQL